MSRLEDQKASSQLVATVTLPTCRPTIIVCFRPAVLGFSFRIIDVIVKKVIMTSPN